MENLCNCIYPSFSLKIEADYGGDPIWCNKCGFNLDMEDLPLSQEIKNEFYEWMEKYGSISSEEHNKIGRALLEKTKKELGPKYEIIFKPMR